MALSFMQWTGLMTSNGRLQCPGCGRFRREADFPDQDAAIRVAGAVVDVVPECRWCREKAPKKVEPIWPEPFQPTGVRFRPEDFQQHPEVPDAP